MRMDRKNNRPGSAPESLGARSRGRFPFASASSFAGRFGFMSSLRRSAGAPRALLVLALLGSAASAQVATVLPFHRTSDLLIGDANNGRILRAHDSDFDGAYSSPGELSVYFDPTVAPSPTTGLPWGNVLGTPSVITADR